MVILSLDNSLSEQELQVASELSLQIVNEVPQDYYLVFDDGQWVVKDGRQGSRFELRQNWPEAFEKIKSQNINYKKDLLCRAVGFKGVSDEMIVDGTLGWGKDSMHLLAAGASVVAYEKHPITALLLKSAWRKAPLTDVIFEMRYCDFMDEPEEWVKECSCLYLDPMFEDLKGKSAPKKGLAFLRQLSHDQQDMGEVIQKALNLGMKRVVVKRPINSEHLNGKPQQTFEGKLIRYDVYIG